jgi:hypothetical protein
LGLDEFCGKSKDTYPPTLRGTRVAPLPACDFGTFRILKNRAILDRYQKEGVMRVSSVIAAGLCFLAVAAPSASPAQSPKAKATKAVVGVVKQTNRWWYSTGEGFVANPPYKFFGDRLVVDKIRNPGKWIAGSGAIFLRWNIVVVLSHRMVVHQAGGSEGLLDPLRTRQLGHQSSCDCRSAHKDDE